MKRINYPLLLIFIIYGCCTINSATTAKRTAISPLPGYSVKNPSSLTDAVTYFAVRKRADFENTFSAAQIMGGSVQYPDFFEEIVVGVAVKPSNKEMYLNFEKAELVGNNLNVFYTYDYSWKELSISSSPTIVATVPKGDGIKTVSFYSQSTLRKVITL